MAQDAEQISALKGRRVSLGGHFEGVVTIEDARPLRSGEGAEIKVRLASGELDETILSPADLAALLESDHRPLAYRRSCTC
jgi:hypothetical protein